MDTLQTDETISGVDGLLFWEFQHHATLPEVIRVEKLLSLLVAAEVHRQQSLPRSAPTTASEFVRYARGLSEAEFAYQETLEEVRNALKRYRWSSSVEGNIEGFHEVLESERTEAEYSTWEYGVVRLLLDRIRTPGELLRFRRCSDCQNWFYASTSHQRFCGPSCRRRYTADSAEFKAKRRNYMKNVYRPQQRQQEARGKALATGSIHSKKKGVK